MRTPTAFVCYVNGGRVCVCVCVRAVGTLIHHRHGFGRLAILLANAIDQQRIVRSVFGRFRMRPVAVPHLAGRNACG